MKTVTILGSTGSIGQNTLEVIRHLPRKFKVYGLSTNTNIEILYKQINEFSPEVVGVNDINQAKRLEKKLKNKIKVFVGQEGIEELAQKKVGILVMAISGSSALLPLMKAIDKQKNIALANKESLVMAGPLIIKKAKEKNTKIIPVDSEQSAIWQCLEGKDITTLKKIYLTASGGPLREVSKKEFKNISLNKVLNHPCWKMGKKVTVDSATLMNKGLELFETMYLFDVEISQIDILIHPEAIVHSMVEFIDGTILAQMSVTDMRIPIQYALSYPQKFECFLRPLDFFKIKRLSFLKPDFNKFPCLALAYEAAKVKGTLPVVLNTSNEVVVEAFLEKRIDFLSIPKIIEKVMSLHKNIKNPTLKDILAVHFWTKNETKRLINKIRYV